MHKRRVVFGVICPWRNSLHHSQPQYGEKNIANGLLLEYHYISFFDKDVGSEVFETIRCCDHGSAITIGCPPDFINVGLFPDVHGNNKTTAVNISRRLKWKGGSIKNDRKIVVTIPMTLKHQLKYSACSIYGGGDYYFGPSIVQLADFSPLNQVSQVLPTRRW